MTEPIQNREMLVLERARKGFAPSAAQRKATLARLGATLAHAPLPLTSSSSAPPPHATAAGGMKTATAFSLRALVTGVVSGVVVGFGAGHLVSRAGGEHSAELRPSVSANTSARTPAPVASNVSVMGLHLPPHGSVSSPPRIVRGEVLAASSAAPQRERIRHDPRRQAAAESADYDELSYVQRAQTALRNGDAALALGLMRTLEQVRPQGALAAERAVLSVLALCQLGRVEEARLAATAALKSGNASEVYRRRLDNSCVGRIEISPSDGSGAP